jgi:uncharacterized protein YdgA (DUF945 family)
MRTPIKWIVGVVVLVGVYLAATAATGMVAHRRVAEFTDHITRQSNGLLRVAETKSSRGFFRSVEDVTFEVGGPFAMMAGALSDTMSAPKFTVHNVIHHGPLPGLRTIGVARVESTLVMDDATRQQLIKTLGTDKPVELYVTLGLRGQTRLEINSPEINAQAEDGTNFAWKGMKSHIEYSWDFEDVTASASLPGASITTKDGSTVTFDNIAMEGDFSTWLETLYVGDGSFKVADIAVTPRASQTPFHVKEASYLVKATADGDYYNVGIQTGAASFESTPTSLQDLHFELGVNHLHGPTTAALYKYAQDMSAGIQNKDPTQQPMSFMEVQDKVSTLLQHDPELVIERLSFGTEHGDFKVSARAKLTGVTAEDTKGFNGMQLLNKLTASADISVAQSLIDNWPAGNLSSPGNQEQLKQMEAQGYLVRKGDRLEAHIEFANGALTANGKPIGPSLAAPARID